MSQKAAIGGNLGGSHFSAAGVDLSNGRLITEIKSVEIYPESSQDKILTTMTEQVNKHKEVLLSQGFEVIGFGTGAPGPANFDLGVIGQTPNMPTMRGCYLAQKIAERTELSSKINNDANLTVYGEACHGAGKGFRRVYGVTLGTGFGHGFVFDGQIYDGADFQAMEMAKAPIYINENSVMTIESKVCTAAIVNYFFELTGIKADPKKIEEIAKNPTLSGHWEAIETYNQFGKWLGFTLCWAQGLLAPDVMVMGGNLAKGWDCFAPAMFSMLKKHTWKQNVNVVPAQLGEAACIIGGASLFD